MINLAIIGGGAISELFHIPAALNSKKVCLVGVYDINEKRAKEIARKFNILNYGIDYTSDLNNFDAAIVAIPNNLHCKITLDLLKNHKNVLVEKPMALSVAECEKMIDVSKEKNKVLCVGHIRRFYNTNRFIKKIIENELFGEVQEVNVQEGSILNWPLVTNALVNKEAAGGGVLFDLGVHVIDLLQWWFGDFYCNEYKDDSMGGVEADCNIVFSLKNSGKINVILSRQRNLSNEITIIFEKAAVIVGNECNTKICIEPTKNNNYKLTGYLHQNNQIEDNLLDLMTTQIGNFAESIKKNCKPEVDAASAFKTIEIIEDCYSKKQKIEYEWEQIQ